MYYFFSLPPVSCKVCMMKTRTLGYSYQRLFIPSSDMAYKNNDPQTYSTSSLIQTALCKSILPSVWISELVKKLLTYKHLCNYDIFASSHRVQTTQESRMAATAAEKNRDQTQLPISYAFKNFLVLRHLSH